MSFSSLLVLYAALTVREWPFSWLIILLCVLISLKGSCWRHWSRGKRGLREPLSWNLLTGARKPPVLTGTLAVISYLGTTEKLTNLFMSLRGFKGFFFFCYLASFYIIYLFIHLIIKLFIYLFIYSFLRCLFTFWNFVKRVTCPADLNDVSEYLAKDGRIPLVWRAWSPPCLPEEQKHKNGLGPQAESLQPCLVCRAVVCWLVT